MPIYLLALFGKNQNAFSEISADLVEVIKHTTGNPTKAVEDKPESINVKAVREKIGMSQQKVCAAFSISIDTLRHWVEGGRSLRELSNINIETVNNSVLLPFLNITF
jgi:putative transcriptional regulator